MDSGDGLIRGEGKVFVNDQEVGTVVCSNCELTPCICAEVAYEVEFEEWLEELIGILGSESLAQKYCDFMRKVITEEGSFGEAVFKWCSDHNLGWDTSIELALFIAQGPPGNRKSREEIEAKYLGNILFGSR